MKDLGIKFGGIYRGNNNLSAYWKNKIERLNDQWYNFWFPIKAKDNEGKTQIYMIDTYQFDIPYKFKKDYKAMVEFLQSLGGEHEYQYLVRKPFDYYYRARVLIDEHSVNAFELVADLSEYRLAENDKETRYYDDENVVYRVMLWNYQNSGYGCNLLKKDAKLRYDLKIENLIRDIDIKAPFISNYDISKVLDVEKEAIIENANYNKNKIEYILRLQKYIDRISKNYTNYKKRLKKELLEEAIE